MGDGVGFARLAREKSSLAVKAGWAGRAVKMGDKVGKAVVGRHTRQREIGRVLVGLTRIGVQPLEACQDVSRVSSWIRCDH